MEAKVVRQFRVESSGDDGSVPIGVLLADRGHDVAGVAVPEGGHHAGLGTHGGDSGRADEHAGIRFIRRCNVHLLLEALALATEEVSIRRDIQAAQL